MAINLTDSLNAATTKGKLGAAKQIYLEGDTKNLQQKEEENDSHFDTLDNRSTQIENSLKSIAVTGGASVADAVTYNNETSGLSSTNAQAAIDELSKKITFKHISDISDITPKDDDDTIKIPVEGGSIMGNLIN